MFENGLSLHVQGDAAVSSIAPVGGFSTQLPKDQLLPSWSYLVVSEAPEYTLQGPVTLCFRRVQIDCYGDTAADCIMLAAAINPLLDGFTGVLADPEQTYVQGCFRSNLIDFFDDVARNYRRMLEYEIWFDQQ